MDSGPLHVFRVTVRGQFHDLDDAPAVRQALVDTAADHDIFRSAFTADGTFTYEPALVAFNLRYEVRRRGDDAHQAALDEGIERAIAYLSGRNISHRHLRASATDMADMWRAARRG